MTYTKLSIPPASAPPATDLDARLRRLLDEKLDAYDAQLAEKLSRGEHEPVGEQVVVASRVRIELEDLIKSEGLVLPDKVTDQWIGNRLRDWGYVTAPSKEAERVWHGETSGRQYPLERPKP